MSATASQITGLTTVYSGTDQRKSKAPRHWPLWGEFTGDRWIPRIKASNAENVSIWWRHYEIPQCTSPISHNTPFRKEMCIFMSWMVHCGMRDRCITGFVNLVYCSIALTCISKIHTIWKSTNISFCDVTQILWRNADHQQAISTIVYSERNDTILKKCTIQINRYIIRNVNDMKIYQLDTTINRSVSFALLKITNARSCSTADSNFYDELLLLRKWQYQIQWDRLVVLWRHMVT